MLTDTKWTRRNLLAAGLLAAAAGPAGALAPERRFFRQHGLAIGIQFYMLGPDAAKDLDRSFAQLAAIGYRTVELQGLLGRTGAQLRAALDRAGLVCPSIHVQAQGQLDGDIARLTDDLSAIGVRTAITPRPLFPAEMGTGPASGESGVDFFRRGLGLMTADQWKRNAAFLNEKGAILAKSGIRIGYHNHNGEFAPVGSSTGFDLLLANTDSRLVTFELDIGWVAAAGVDPVALLRRHKGRFALAHLKDIAASTAANFTLSMVPAEIGAGKLPWRALLAAAHAAGVRDFYVEQEPPFTHSRMEAAKISYDYLSSVLS